MSVMGIIMVLVVPMILGAREAVQSEQLRTSVNQGLRGGSDLIGSDIRVAGERFPSSSVLVLPPIEIVHGEGDDPDEIVLRRNLWDATLPVCERVNGTEQNFIVVRDSAWMANPPGSNFPECGQPLNDDGWPVSLAEIGALADTIGVDGNLMGYILDPTEPMGEFIEFGLHNNAKTNGNIRRSTADALENDYRRNNRPRIYVMSERRYRVVDDVLELVINQDEDAALRVVADVLNLQAEFVMNDGSVVGAIPDDMTWRDIAAIEITLTTESTMDNEVSTNTLTSRYFPRNVLSR